MVSTCPHAFVGLHSLMLPYVPHDVTWEICGVTVIIPSQILKRIDEESVIDTWELEAATDIKAGNLTSCATDHLLTLAADFQPVLASLAEAAQARAKSNSNLSWMVVFL